MAAALAPFAPAAPQEEFLADIDHGRYLLADWPSRHEFDHLPHRVASVRPARAIVFLTLVAGCGDGPVGGRDPVPSLIRLLSPNTQAGTPGWPLADSVVVEVLDGEGNALSGVPVTWVPAAGAGAVEPAADTTNVAGRVSAEWALGLGEGEEVLSIAAGDLPPLTVHATASLLHAASVTLGGNFACALSASGQAFCWGDNRFGQLGDGTVGDSAIVPRAVLGGLTFGALSASGAHACGVSTGGTAYCWGSNEDGETGTGAAGAPVPVPTPVQAALRFTSVSAEGRGSSDNSTCALTAGGEAWCWGDNVWGKLGDGTQTDASVPVRVQTATRFTWIETGYFHTCAKSLAGALWCWGEQETDQGAFGARPAGFYTTPVAVHEDFTFEDVSLGRNYTCGLTAGQAAFCWGTNWFGSLGTGQADGESAVPLAVAGGIAFRSLAAAGMEENHGLAADGILYRWGSIGNDVAQLTPVAVTQAITFSSLDSGGIPFEGRGGACGVASGGAVYCVSDLGAVRGVPAPAEP